MTPKQAQKLSLNIHVEEVEGEGCDNGVYFVHLKPGLDFDIDSFCFRQSKTFESYREAVKALKKVVSIVDGTKRY